MRLPGLAVMIGLVCLVGCLTGMRHNTTSQGIDAEVTDTPAPDDTDRFAGSDESPGILEFTRTAVDRNCGSCHHSNRSTNHKALSIFDLANSCWYCTLTKDRIPGLEKRTQGSDDFTEAEQEAIRQVIAEIAEGS